MRTKQQVAKCCPPLGEGVAEDPAWIASPLFGVRNDVVYAGAGAWGRLPPLEAPSGVAYFLRFSAFWGVFSLSVTRKNAIFDA